MQIRRFEASDVREALRQVKEVMGPEAIILSTKTIQHPFSRFGFSKRSVIEVVAANDGPNKPSAGSSPMHDTPDPLRPSVRNDRDIIQRILSTGLTPEFVHGLVREIETMGKDLTGPNICETVRNYLHWKLMESVDVTGPASEGTKIWVFVGPTGVGKTTTLAKLAAHFRIRANKKITLITFDTYRLGAVDQLRTYARILELPLEIAYHREGLKQIIERNIHQDLLLIDTMGSSPNDTRRLEVLRDFLTVHPKIENHLVLSATTKDKDLARIVEGYGFLPIKSYIFTKIDETEEYGPLFNQIWRDRKPLSYLTNGQKVPEDIELATKMRVANLVLSNISWN